MLRNVIDRLHKWTGLVMGLWVALLGITGSAIVYQHEIRQRIEPGRAVESDRPAQSLGEVLTAVRAARPDATILALRGLHRPNSAWEVLIRPTPRLQDARASQVLLVDPTTGIIQGEQTFSNTAMGFLAQLHINLLNGNTGLLLNGVGGAFSMLLGISGLVLWWRRARSSRDRLHSLWRRSPNGLSVDLHTTGGFFVSWFLLLTGVSGVYFAAPRPVLSLGAAVSGSHIAVLAEFMGNRPSDSPPGGADAEENVLLAIAQRQFPGSQLYQLTLPVRPADAWRFQFRPPGGAARGETDLVILDRRTAAVLVARSSRDLPRGIRAVMWLQPLHFGIAGGAPTRMLWAILGLAPALLMVTGFTMWWRRRRAVRRRPRVSPRS